MEKEKERFLNYCRMFAKELSDLQNDLEFEQDEEQTTLAYIGANYSYELANIGFELGYMAWHFFGNGVHTFEEVRDSFTETIICDLRIENLKTENEIAEIEKELKNARPNWTL